MLYLKVISTSSELKENKSSRFMFELEHALLNSILDEPLSRTITKSNKAFLSLVLEKLQQLECPHIETQLNLMGSSLSYLLGHRNVSDVSDYDFFIPLSVPKSEKILHSIYTSIYSTLYYLENNMESTLPSETTTASAYKTYLKQYYNYHSSDIDNPDLKISFLLMKGPGKLELKFTFNTQDTFLFGDEALIVKNALSSKPSIISFYGTPELPEFLMKNKFKVCIKTIDQTLHGYYRLKWHNGFKKLPYQTAHFKTQWANSFVLLDQTQSPYTKLFSVLRSAYDHSYIAGEKQAKQFLHDFLSLPEFNELPLISDSDHSTYLKKLYSTLVSFKPFEGSKKLIPSKLWSIDDTPFLEWSDIFSFFDIKESDPSVDLYIQNSLTLLNSISDLSNSDQSILLRSIIEDWNHYLSIDNSSEKKLSTSILYEQLSTLLIKELIHRSPKHATQNELLNYLPTTFRPLTIEPLNIILKFLKDYKTDFKNNHLDYDKLDGLSSALITTHILKAINATDPIATLEDTNENSQLLISTISTYITEPTKTDLLFLFEFLVWAQSKNDPTILDTTPSKKENKKYKPYFKNHYDTFLPKTDLEFIFLLECATFGVDVFKTDIKQKKDIVSHINSLPIEPNSNKDTFTLFLVSYISFLSFSEEKNDVFTEQLSTLFKRINETNSIDFNYLLTTHPDTWSELSRLTHGSLLKQTIHETLPDLDISKTKHITKEPLLTLIFKWFTSTSDSLYEHYLDQFLKTMLLLLKSPNPHAFLNKIMIQAFTCIDSIYERNADSFPESTQKSFIQLRTVTLSHLNVLSKHDKENNYDDTLLLVWHIQKSLPYSHTKLVLSSICSEFTAENKKNKIRYSQLNTLSSNLYYSIYVDLFDVLTSLTYTPSLNVLHRVNTVQRHFLSKVDLNELKESLIEKTKTYLEHLINSISVEQNNTIKKQEIRSFFNEIVTDPNFQYLLIPALSIIEPYGLDITNNAITNLIGKDNHTILKQTLSSNLLLNGFSKLSRRLAFTSASKQVTFSKTLLQLKNKKTFIIPNKHVHLPIDICFTLLQSDYLELQTSEPTSEKINNIIACSETINTLITSLFAHRQFSASEKNILKDYQFKYNELGKKVIETLFLKPPTLTQLDSNSLKPESILRTLFSYNVSKNEKFYFDIKSWILSPLLSVDITTLNSNEFETLISIYSDFYLMLSSDISEPEKGTMSKFLDGEKELIDHIQERLLKFNTYWNDPSVSDVYDILFFYKRSSHIDFLSPIDKNKLTTDVVTPFKRMLLDCIKNSTKSSIETINSYIQIFLFLSDRIKTSPCFPSLLNNDLHSHCVTKFYKSLPSIIKTEPLETPFSDIQKQVTLCLTASDKFFSVPEDILENIKTETSLKLTTKIHTSLSKPTLTINDITMILSDMAHLQRYNIEKNEENNRLLYSHILQLDDLLPDDILEFKLHFEHENGLLLDLPPFKITDISFETDMTFRHNRFWPDPNEFI